MSNTMTELDIAYPHSPLSVTGIRAPGGDLPTAGERWPILAKDTTPIGAGNTPRFALIANSDAAKGVANHFTGVTTQFTAPNDMNGLWMVRPDGYVGLVARHDDTGAAEAYLSSIVG
jgi:hypothetical protein